MNVELTIKNLRRDYLCIQWFIYNVYWLLNLLCLLLNLFKFNFQKEVFEHKLFSVRQVWLCKQDAPEQTNWKQFNIAWLGCAKSSINRVFEDLTILHKLISWRSFVRFFACILPQNKWWIVLDIYCLTIWKIFRPTDIAGKLWPTIVQTRHFEYLGIQNTRNGNEDKVNFLCEKFDWEMFKKHCFHKCDATNLNGSRGDSKWFTYSKTMNFCGRSLH